MAETGRRKARHWAERLLSTFSVRSHTKPSTSYGHRMSTQHRDPFEGMGVAAGLMVGAPLMTWAPGFFDAQGSVKLLWYLPGGAFGIAGFVGIPLEVNRLRRPSPRPFPRLDEARRPRYDVLRDDRSLPRRRTLLRCCHARPFTRAAYGDRHPCLMPREPMDGGDGSARNHLPHHPHQEITPSRSGT